MHELSIIQNVLDIVLDNASKNNAVKVTGVSLTIGELSDIVPKWAELYFAMVSKDTMAEGAEVTVEQIPAIVLCGACGAESRVKKEKPEYCCPQCKSGAISLISGREFSITSIEIQTSEHIKV